MPEKELIAKKTTGKKLNILFITRAKASSGGGLERLSYEMIKEISSSSNFNCQVIKPGSSVSPHLVINRMRSAIFALTVIPRAAIQARQADIVHITDPVLSIAGRIVKFTSKAAVSCNVHGLDLVYANKIYRIYLNLFFDNFDGYFTNSNYVLIILNKRNIRARAKVVNPGIYDRIYDPDIKKSDIDDVVRQKISDKTILFTSGRLVKRKGHAWFIKNVLPQLKGDFKYIIAGDGPERKSITEAINRNNMAKKVLVMGRVSDKVLNILYNACDIFIQPNINIKDDIEGFGLVLIEAASCKKLVLASRLQGMTDAIRHGKNGLLIEPGNSEKWVNSLNNYIVNTKERERLAEKARVYTLNNFSWNVLKSKYVRFFLDTHAAGR